MYIAFMVRVFARPVKLPDFLTLRFLRRADGKSSYAKIKYTLNLIIHTNGDFLNHAFTEYQTNQYS